MDVSDQRRTRRFELRLPFELVRAGSRQVTDQGETKNVSSGGVLFTSDEEIEIGDPIEYYITLSAADDGGRSVKLHCVGKVIRRQEPRDEYESDAPVMIAATLERYEFVRSRR